MPWATVYSTFLQRGYDQVVHDVALQKLPVRFAMDRAGLVGADGATHAGSFDVTYMASLPHMVTMAPSNEVELVNMVATMSAYDQGPSCVRYVQCTSDAISVPFKFCIAHCLFFLASQLLKCMKYKALVCQQTELKCCDSSAGTPGGTALAWTLQSMTLGRT